MRKLLLGLVLSAGLVGCEPSKPKPPNDPPPPPQDSGADKNPQEPKPVPPK
ncbi:unnamed protein product [Gemmata massiliana]|uniref:Lipoprotein n=1 Tax=Gemmata massiliana TaxID=1210884 RepID=A0A6P2CT72_9BACT|nr:hypothetical protein [Gemmata massiliana]VTR91305.1 unnamed protein product [Gemmata massiliana]